MTTFDVKCGECGAAMILRASKYGPFWGCSTWPKCQGTHGAHPNGSPLGIPADKATKAARVAAHAAFDVLWKGNQMTRKQAYAWLRSAMELPSAHIGGFTIAECDRLVAIMKERGMDADPTQGDNPHDPPDFGDWGDQ